MMTAHQILNPIVRGLAPDPSACRVGADYFLATSAGNFWPGIPLRHSTDLQNWQTIGHAITRPEQYRRDGLPGQLKLYAPTLRHHDGRFYLACTNVAPGQGNFIIWTDDPAGEWSDALWVDSDAFDPSLTFDGSTAYYTRRTVMPGKEGSGPVVQAEIDIATGTLLTAPRVITPGAAGYRSNDIEGPHLYRVGEWWYLFSAEGGTWKGHMQTVARSRSPWGPFEGFDGNPVLTHRNRVGHPIQSTGHAELLDDTRGNWWAVFLGTRHNGPVSWHHLGRETFLAPVTWAEGWPVVGDRGGVELTMPSPHPLPERGKDWPHDRTVWTAGWATREHPLDGVLITADEGEGARIALPESSHRIADGGPLSAAFLRQENFDCVFEATVDAVPTAPASAGISVYASELHHYDLTASTVPTAAGSSVEVTLSRSVGDLLVTHSIDVGAVGSVELRVVASPSEYSFFTRADNGEWTSMGSGLVRLLSAETSQTYSGVLFGVVALGSATQLSRVRVTRGIE